MSDIIVGQKDIKKLFGGRHWSTILKMIEDEGCPVKFRYGRWECNRIMVEMWHRERMERRPAADP